MTTTSTEITLEPLKAAYEAVVAEFPDKKNPRCVLFEDGKPVCVAGHALARAFPDYQPNFGYLTVGNLRSHDIPEEEAERIAAFMAPRQFLADDGYPWGRIDGALGRIEANGHVINPHAVCDGCNRLVDDLAKTGDPCPRGIDTAADPA